jgi:hypothetical protein
MLYTVAYLSLVILALFKFLFNAYINYDYIYSLQVGHCTFFLRNAMDFQLSAIMSRTSKFDFRFPILWYYIRDTKHERSSGALMSVCHL